MEVLRKDGIPLVQEVMEVALRQGDLQKYLLSGDIEFLKLKRGQPLCQARPAFLQGVLAASPSGQNLARPRQPWVGVGVAAGRSIQMAGPSSGGYMCVCV